jgi:hypothetical protein
MNIYLAGPMSGLPHFNAEAFNDAAEFLREQGHEVFNPVENAVCRYGPELFEGNYDGDILRAARHGFSLRAVLFEGLQWICTKGEAIALLPGWEESSGARPEWETARALKLHFIYL